MTGNGQQAAGNGMGASGVATSVAQPLADRIARAHAALDTVVDPELPFLTIAELGIVRDVRSDGETVEVIITPTYSGCPAADFIALAVDTALAQAGIGAFCVRQQRAPAWTTDWMTAAAREKLRANGIAPPVQASGRRALFSVVEVACPACGSRNTRRVSEFGSTACKAHYACDACGEPFQYFKCI